MHGILAEDWFDARRHDCETKSRNFHVKTWMRMFAQGIPHQHMVHTMLEIVCMYDDDYVIFAPT